MTLGSSGGMINVTGANVLTVPGVINGNGALTLSGSGTVLLQGSNNYSAQTNVNSGTLRVDGSIASSSTIVNGSTAVLSGSGTIGPVNVAVGTVAPGDSGSGTLTTANLSLAAGTSLNYTLANPGGGSPLSSAALTLPISGSVNVNINNIAAPLPFGTYPLISYSSLSGGNSPFNNTFAPSFSNTASTMNGVRPTYTFVNTVPPRGK